MAGRPFDSGVPSAVWDDVQVGVLRSVYRGVPCWKSPFDLALYLQLLARLRPPTVIEIGAKHGGSALFFADILSADQLTPRILSVDIDEPPDIDDERIRFLRGDALALEAVLDDELLAGLPHPFLVVEDSSHRFETSLAVLEFFDDWLVAGDYIVIEDGIVGQLSDARYRAYEDGPSRAIEAFLAARPDRYEVDATLCDLYGFNVTYNPNGWLRRR